MGNKLDAIRSLEDYRLIAVLHHHIVAIPKPEWYNEKWYKKFLPSKFIENSLRLRDAAIFLEWLKNRNVRIVLHGHKHVPFIVEQDGLTIIACGSSTGHVTHIDNSKTCISYNILRIDKNAVTCTQYVEEIAGAGVKDINTVIV